MSRKLLGWKLNLAIQYHINETFSDTMLKYWWINTCHKLVIGHWMVVYGMVVSGMVIGGMGIGEFIC